MGVFAVIATVVGTEMPNGTMRDNQGDARGTKFDEFCQILTDVFGPLVYTITITITITSTSTSTMT